MNQQTKKRKYIFKRKYLWYFLIVIFVLTIIGAAYIYYFAFIDPHKKLETLKKEPPLDAIIVPGFPFNGEKWDDVMRMRVVWSAYLYKKGLVKNIIYSGSAVHSPYIEAEIMAKYGKKLGIDSARIYTEPKAEHSTENIWYGYEIAKANGFERVGVATDPFQMMMFKGFIKDKFDDKLVLVPIVFDTLKRSDTINPVIDPKSAYVNNFKSLKTREGFWERLKGTLGRKIEKEESGR